MAENADTLPMLSASTHDVSVDEQFEYFCESLCEIYLGISPQRVDAASFSADVLAFDLGEDNVLSRIRAPGHEAHRDRRSIAAVADDAFFLNVAADSPARLTHLGEQFPLRAGQPVLIDNRQPFRLALSAPQQFHLYTVRIPRAALGESLSDLDITAVNRRLASAEGAVLATQARLMHSEFDAGRIRTALAMTQVMGELLRRLFENDGVARSAADYGHALTVDGLTSLASRQLDNPEFRLSDLARLLSRSVRSVQGTFAADGLTWSSWALEIRLKNARTRIESPRWAEKSLAHIAAASGFRDASHFHRAFRSRFGAAPSAFRPR